jgi:energy-coupling factor transport system ATP-binding protein
VSDGASIEFRGVWAGYRPEDPVLRDLTCSIGPGEPVLLIGSNGSGKSTLSRCCLGLVPISTGELRIAGNPIAGAPTWELARTVGYVFQRPDDQLLERTIEAEVAFGPRQLGRSAGEVERAVDIALDLCGLTAQRRVHPQDTGLATRRLITLAAVLSMETPIVILDEPTAGQDLHGVAVLERCVSALRAAGRTLLVISHDLDLASQWCDRVLVLEAGQLVADGPTDEVLSEAWLPKRAGAQAPQLVRVSQALGLPGTTRAETLLDRIEQG